MTKIFHNILILLCLFHIGSIKQKIKYHRGEVMVGCTLKWLRFMAAKGLL